MNKIRFLSVLLLLAMIMGFMSSGGRVNPVSADSGTIIGWGYNGYGGLNIPPGLEHITAIAASGSYHTVALKSDGTVVAWGWNLYGQTNVPAGLSSVIAIAAGHTHNLALKSDGTVVSWGCEGDPSSGILLGQCDVPAGLSNVRAVSVGIAHSLALKSDGTVVAWGWNRYGQASVPDGLSGVIAISAGGYHSMALKSDGTVVAWGSNGFGQVSIPAGLTGIAAISAGRDHSMVLKSDGTVVAWGSNYRNQSIVPEVLSGVTAIAAGAWHSMAMKSDGTVVTWGSNSYGETDVPAGLSGVTAIAAGEYYSVVLQGGRPVGVWGCSNYGYEKCVIPVGLSNATDIAAGVGHSVAVKSDGMVAAWGSNAVGQLNIPSELSNVVTVGIGQDFTLALKSDGTVAAWGHNNDGQTNVPTGLVGVTAVDGGSFHSLALKSDGTVVGWGGNVYGQATPPAGLSDVTAISTGSLHSLALKSNGTVVGWGFNGSGVATPPAGLSNVIAISAGSTHNLALKSDGTVVAWGENTYGQAAVPAGLSGVKAIAAGAWHSVALKSDGTIVAWGDNQYGQLNVPAWVTKITAISSTSHHVLALGQVKYPPVALRDFYTTNEDTTLTIAAPGVLENDTDRDSTSFTAVLVTGPSHGTLNLNANGSFTYVPESDYSGSDSFTYHASDGEFLSNVTTDTITVKAVNDAPVAQDQSQSTNEETSLLITLTATDAENSDLTYSIVNAPAHGTLSGMAPNVTYSPDDNWNGSDSFTFKANDGALDSSTGTVSITVNNINDAPVGVDDSYTMDEDTVFTSAAPGVLSNDTDADGDPLTATLYNSGPFYGTVALNADGSFTYTPAENYHGWDRFTYQVDDGGQVSDFANATFTVNPVNDAPIAYQYTGYEANEDNMLYVYPEIGLLNRTEDADGDTLTAILVEGPEHGTLIVNPNGSFYYTPAPDFSGIDSFVFKANDGTVDSNDARVTIFVSDSNDAPVVHDDAYTTNEDATLTIAAPGILSNDTDLEGDMFTAVQVSGPTHGALNLQANGSFTYTPVTNYVGTDSFTYKASDGKLDSNIATVVITVNGVNDAPVAANDAYTTDEDIPLTIAAHGVLSNDTDLDGDSLTAVLVEPPLRGSLTLNANGSFKYTPYINFSGVESFTYQADDGALSSNVVTVNITVNEVNDGPATDNDSYTTGEDTALTIAAPGVLGNDMDTDSELLTAILVSPPTHGALTLNADGSFTYVPVTGFIGNDLFTYKANDGALDSNVGEVTIVVNDINHAPVAQDDVYGTKENTDLTIAAPGLLTNDTDQDGDGLTVVLVSSPANGKLTLNTDGSFTYIPNCGYSGSDSFIYKANDGLQSSNLATVVITIEPVNHAPLAVDDAYTTDEDVALNIAAPGILTNDTDPDGDQLGTVLVTGPAHGTLTLYDDGSFSYTSAANYAGQDSFTYTAYDKELPSETATVTLTVNPANDAPAAVDDSFATDEDTALTIAAPGLLSNDTDLEGDQLTALLVAGPAHGTLALNADGSFTYTPSAGYEGPDSFTYQANDGGLGSNVAAVSITVNPVSPANSTPQAANDSFNTTPNTSLTIAVPGVLANDTDPDAGNLLSAVLVDGPAHGTLVLEADGSFTYTPAVNYAGPDSFTYKANDGELDSNTATVSIAVLYNFTGFFQPVDNLPAENTVKAGSGVPVKFSLSGDMGLAILAVGSPTSKQVTCPASNTVPSDPIEETTTSTSGLHYDPLAEEYIYVWKTNKTWANTCRMFTIQFVDGSNQQALFKFTR